MQSTYLIFASFLLLALLAAVYVVVPFLRGGADKNANMFVYQDGTVTIRDVMFLIEVADTMLQRATGLSGRETLGTHEGMLFVFPASGKHSFWMMGMRFPIDILWIRNGRIVWIKERAAPEDWKRGISYAPSEPADMVLEVLAGTVAHYGWGVGDEVVVGAK